MVEMTFNLDPEIEEKLKILAEKAGMTPEEFLSDLLEKKFGDGSEETRAIL